MNTDWAQVLDHIQHSLGETLAAVVVPPEPADEPAQPEFGRETVERLTERRAQLESRAAAARQQAQQLEALLTFEVESLDAWLAAAAEVGQRLARAAGHSI